MANTVHAGLCLSEGDTSYQFCISPHCSLEMANLSEANGEQKLAGCSQAVPMSLPPILCISSIHVHDWQPAQTHSSIARMCRGPSASRWSRCSCSPAQRRYSLAKRCIDMQCRQIINTGDDNLEQDRFLLLYSRGGKNCWPVPSEGGFLVQKARSTCLTCWLRLRVLAGWKRQAQIKNTDFGLSQTSGLVHEW